ncbi:MAG: TolC family protein [Gemmatimonadaceae bacterium]
MRFFALSVVISCALAPLAPLAAGAQTAAPAPVIGQSLSLTDAIAIARRSNPSFQTSLNARKSAAASARSANGVFLPSVNSSIGGGYRAGGQSLLNGTTQGATSGTLSSSGNVSANLSVSAAQFSDRKATLVERDIADADIARDEQSLRINVTNQYIAVLQAQATARLQDTLLVSSSSQLELAKAKLQVGTGIQLDVNQAEVANGRQRVAVLKAHNQIDIEKIRLYQQMGVEPVLSTQLQELSVMELPSLTLDQLLTNAKASNPALASNRARERQSNFRVTSARRAYLPSFSIQTSIGGFAQRFTDTQQLLDQAQSNAPLSIASCQRTEGVYQQLGLANTYAQCESRFGYSPATEARIRDAQSGFPFGFTRNPLGFNLQLSLPIFNGFQREAGVQNATIARANAQNVVRQQEIQLGADITVAYMTLQTSQQTVAQQELNSRTATLALQLATQRYQVGSISLVDLITARTSLEQAESDRIAAIYEFQRAFAQLEAAVGRPLR